MKWPSARTCRSRSWLLGMPLQTRHDGSAQAHLSGRDRRRSTICSSPTAGGRTSLRSTSRAVGRSAGLGAISHLTSLATCDESTEQAERPAGGQQARRYHQLDKLASLRGAQLFCVETLGLVLGETLA